MFIHADVDREFNLSGAHPKMSKQAVLERRQQQQHDDDLTFRPNTSGARGRSQSAGRQRPTGDQRLEQLARPKTAHWDKCKYVCPPTSVCHMTCSPWVCVWDMLSDICALTQTTQAVFVCKDRYHFACANHSCVSTVVQRRKEDSHQQPDMRCFSISVCLYATLPVPSMHCDVCSSCRHILCAPLSLQEQSQRPTSGASVSCSRLWHISAGAQLKLEEDGQQLTGCTFAPKTGRPPKEDAAPKQPFPDRLYRRRDGKYAQVRLHCNAWTTFISLLRRHSSPA